MIETVIVLAAGQGTRLRPLTDNLPKGMVPLHGKALLEWQLDSIKSTGVKNIVIVTGYEADSIQFEGVTTVVNERFAETNMVASLMCAKEHFGDGFVLAYSDIVYRPEVLQRLLATGSDVACVVDDNWQGYWEARFGDPLLDAETLRLEGDRIIEVGHPPNSIDDIEGQFIGLVAFQKGGVQALLEMTDEAARLQGQGQNLPGCPRSGDGLYTTDLLQALIGKGQAPHAVHTAGGWLEIDDLSDHKLAVDLTSVGPGGLEIKR